MDEVGYAKLNLALHVRAREPDGYHRIETVFAFCEDGDRLAARPAERLELEPIGPFAAGLPAGGDDLVLRAARALGERFGVSAGAALTLDKRLPLASGLGGGSADAGAALRLLKRFWRLPAGGAELLDIAAGLGADVPACLLSCPSRGKGRGDILELLDAPDLTGTPVLLVNPGVPLSTAGVFRAWDGVDRGPLADWEDGRNDLEAAATALVPEIAQVLRALAGARFARMSGSGATCFGLFGTEAERDEISRRIRASNPHWWQLATRLR